MDRKVIKKNQSRQIILIFDFEGSESSIAFYPYPFLRISPTVVMTAICKSWGVIQIKDVPNGPYKAGLYMQCNRRRKFPINWGPSNYYKRFRFWNLDFLSAGLSLIHDQKALLITFDPKFTIITVGTYEAAILKIWIMKVGPTEGHKGLPYKIVEHLPWRI